MIEVTVITSLLRGYNTSKGKFPTWTKALAAVVKLTTEIDGNLISVYMNTSGVPVLESEADFFQGEG